MLKILKRLYKEFLLGALRASLSIVKKIIDHYGLNDDRLYSILVKKNINCSLISDYASPLPVMSDLKKNRKRWEKASSMKGIHYNLGELKNNLLKLSEYFKEYSEVFNHNDIIKEEFGPGYPQTDAMYLYSMIRYYKPDKYIEVGSGVSTYYAHKAVERGALNTKMFCIEPYPYEALYSIDGIKINKSEIQNVELDFFSQLSENDILFVDSAHVVKIDGDVPYLILEVFPLLKSGVIVHVHDIPFPYNFPYPADNWLFRQSWPVFWNEAMMLQAFLINNDECEIIQSLPIIRYHDEEYLKKNISNYKTIYDDPYTFSSLWLRKK